MAIDTIFKDLHRIGQDYMFDKVHDKLKVVIEDKNKNMFLVDGLLSKYSKNQTSLKDDLFDVNKMYIKFRVVDLEEVKDMRTGNIRLNFNLISTVKLDGIKYNVNKFELNNHTRDFIILEITKFKGN